jgi:EmrB/QacA subfamily drug resistance transporter
MNTQTLPSTDLEGIAPSIYERRWKILATLCTSLLLVALGNSSLNLALPTLARELRLTSLELTWIVDIYALVFASLLFTTSAIADRYGRKIIMQLGLLVFLAGTVYAGFVANSGLEVIISRAIMGIGGAMVMPTTLSIIDNVFPRRERPKAIAIWSGIAGGGIALGSVLSGFLLEHYSWQSVFILSTVVGMIGFAFNQWLTPHSRDEKQTPVDWLGGALSMLALLGIVYGIIEAPSRGLDHLEVQLSLGIGLSMLAAFIWWQTRTNHPMLDMKLFKRKTFSVSALAVTLTFFALMGVFFSMSQLFQLVMGYGALESSLRTLPTFILMIGTAPLVPTIVKHIGVRWTVTCGLLLVATAFVAMSQWPTVPNYWHVLGSMAVMMTGMSLTMTPATNMMMSSVPNNRAGMGSAMNDTTRELGGSLGVAVLGSVMSSGYEREIAEVVRQLPQAAQEAASTSLAGAMEVAKALGSNGEQFSLAAKAAWMNGLSESMLIAAAIVMAAAVIAAIWLPHQHAPGHDDELTEPLA